MKKKLLISIMMTLVFLLSSCGGKGVEEVSKNVETSQTQKTQTITDMAGREVKLEGKVEKVYSTNPIGTMLTYTFDDKKLIGLNFDLSEQEKKFTTEYYQKLPNLGGWYGKGKTGNVEEIMKAKPDLVISTGVDQTSIDNADKLQKQLGAPVILLDNNLDKIGDVYRLLGKVLGDEKRGEELATYCEDTVKTAKEISAKIPEDKKVKVYYAEEASGLNTDPKGSQHARIIDPVGATNVADVKAQDGYGRVEVSMEQVMKWNPDYIIACVDNGYDGSGSYDTILKGSAWSNIKAVKDKNVYQTPTAPFNWFDRPPSVNTMIGIKWCQNLLYPEYTNYDLKEETKKFYKLFYHVDITDKDYDYILEKAVRK